MNFEKQDKLCLLDAIKLNGSYVRRDFSYMLTTYIRICSRHIFYILHKLELIKMTYAYSIRKPRRWSDLVSLRWIHVCECAEECSWDRQSHKLMRCAVYNCNYSRRLIWFINKYKPANHESLCPKIVVTRNYWERKVNQSMVKIICNMADEQAIFTIFFRPNSVPFLPE